MTIQTDTDWIRDGARVAELHVNYSGGNTVTFATIKRLTTTQIVLNNTHRYRRDDRRRVGEKGGAWSGRQELCAADDPRVVNAVARQRVSDLLYRISKLGMKYSDGRAEAIAMLDEIDRLAAEARRAIAQGA
jgi:hypothetical protein